MSTQINIAKKVAVKDETVLVTSDVNSINFTGTGITATTVGNDVTVTVPGITVGTTAIASGTVGRVLFEGTGNVVQQDSTLFWDNTNKRLGVGATPASTVRLDVRAQGALSTDIAFRVRNSADTDNIFEVIGNTSIKMLGTSDNGTIRIEKGSGHTIKFIHSSTNALPSICLFGTEAAGGSVGQFQFDALNGSGSYPSLTMSRLIIGMTDLTASSLYSAFGTNAACFVMKNASSYAGIGTNPNAVTDHFSMYSADIAAGNASPHFRTENGAIIKLYQVTTAVAASTLTGGGGTNITDTDTFDGYTLKQIVKALRNTGLLA